MCTLSITNNWCQKHKLYNNNYYNDIIITERVNDELYNNIIIIISV